jgi:aminoglycoside phosphotransferase (APT) family kinase protein
VTAPAQALVAALSGWLGGARVELTGAPSGAGWSGDLLLLEADGRPLVLRRAPAEPGMFDEHDLDLQVRCLRHVRAHGLPAPEVVAADPTGDRLGRPAYLMARVAGRVPADGRPSFTEAGFLAEASPREQRRYGEHLVDCLATLHTLPPLALPLGPDTGAHLRWCERVRDPAAPGAALLDRAHRVLAGTLPPPAGPPALLWGDARPANTVVGPDFRVAALLDWELAGTGAPELDVAWLLEMNRMRAGGADPPLPGFPDEARVWRRWSAVTGRDPAAPEWFRAFAAYRVVVLMDLHLADRVRRGGLPADHPVRSANRARRRLAALLDGTGGLACD